MKSKKIKILKFTSEKKLLLKVREDFYRNKTILISGGNTFNFFLKYLYKKNKVIQKKLILFDERISKIKKNRNFNKINKFLIKSKILKKENFFSFEYLKNTNDLKKKNLIYKKIIKYPKPNLALVGVGNDGHIGSIFPKTIVKYKNFVISKKKNENFRRISLNIDYIKKVKKIVIVINDRKKNDILKKILSNHQNYKIPVLKLIKISMDKVLLYYINKSTKKSK